LSKGECPSRSYLDALSTDGFVRDDDVLSIMDSLVTTKVAIKYLKISKPTYLKYIRLGRIKAVKAGSGWRVHRSELHRFLKVRNG